MKLEELLGEELYKQVQAKIDEANGKEPDKLKHIRYADLSEGGYVNKSKYNEDVEKLNNLLSGKESELTTANNLIAELKKGAKGNEEMQGKIGEYEKQVQELQAQLAETQIKAALKVALLSEEALDVDYLSYKLTERLSSDGKKLELDENGNIKDWKELATGLKTQFPTQFKADSEKKVDEIKLPEGDAGQETEPKTLADAIQQRYEENG